MSFAYARPQSTIISVHAGVARQIARSPHFRGTVQYMEFSGITSMYGAVHCASQVICRTPGEKKRQDDSGMSAITERTRRL